MAKSAANTKEASSQLDWLKWLVVVVLIGGAVVANYRYADESLLYRTLAFIGVTVVACVIALQTAYGASFWELAKGARTEIRKVVWPTHQETVYTTLIVIVFVVILGLILWLLDTGLGWVASKLIA